MSTPAPPSLVEAFCAGGTVDVDYSIIPVPSQVGVSPELASFTDGFPPATRKPRTAGGIPPRGLDMNGILYMATAHIAWLSAGNSYPFNADVVAIAGGYRVGAVVQSAVTPSLYFQNTLANNTNDPDSVLTGWLPFSPISNPIGVQPNTLAAGTTNNLAITAGVGFLELTANAAGSTLTGLAGGFNGQIVVATNVSANALTFAALTGSTAGNQFRLPADITVLQYGHVAFRKSTALNIWVPMS